MMSKYEEARRAVSFSGKQHDGSSEGGERVGVRHPAEDYSCSKTGGATSNRPAYSQQEVEERQKRARERMERAKEKQRAARYFHKLYKGCVRRV